MMNRTPIQLRNRERSDASQKTKRNLEKKSGKGNSLNVNKSFDLHETVSVTSNNTSTKYPTLSKILNLQLNEDELKKMSSDEKILLILNRSDIIMKAHEELHETVIQYQNIISELVKKNQSLELENTNIKENLIQLERIGKLNSEEISKNNLLVQKENDSLRDMNNYLKEELDIFKTQIMAGKNGTDKQNESLLIDYERMKQNLKSDEIEIWGIKESKDENLLNLVLNVAQKFDVHILESEIVFVKRRKTKIATRQNIPNPIRVKFYNRKKRDELIKSGRMMKVKSDDNADEKNGRNFIYINEALTLRNEFLFGRVRELKRKKKISKGWCRWGKIFIQEGNDPPMLVNRLEDLDGF